MRSGNMPKSLYQNWQFAIEVNGFDVALFHKGQEPKTEFEEVAFAPAGSMFDQKVAGRVKFEDITLEKGNLQDGSDEAAREWIKKQVDVNAVTGGLNKIYNSIPISPRNREGCFVQPKTWAEKVRVRLSWARVMATKQFRRSSCISRELSPFLTAAQLGS
jgi:hypothetical protein